MPPTPLLQDWIGRSQTRADRISGFPARALDATLNHDGPGLAAGDALPALYHWLYFLDAQRLDETNYDGHARLGGFLPPITLPRRMWAGGRLRFQAPLRIGAQLRRSSTVQSVSEKTGRSGPLVFVTIRHQIREGRVLCLEEEHDIVYRDAPADVAGTSADPNRGDTGPEGGRAKASGKALTAPPDCDFRRQITPDPVMLFRYSALTFNGHRIHYDLPFCQAEGYSGLVVHGPLLATLLTDLVRRNLPQERLADFSFKALSPVYADRPFTIHGTRIGPDRLHLWVSGNDGTKAMDAVARLAR